MDQGSFQSGQRSLPSVNNPKELYSDFRNKSGREHVQQNLCRIVISDLQIAADSHRISKAVWFVVNAEENSSLFEHMLTSLRREMSHEPMLLTLIEDDKVFRKPSSPRTEKILRVLARPSGKEVKLAQPSLIERLRELEATSRDQALDLLYDEIDDFLTESKFDELNQLLANVRVESLSIHLLLGLLTATLPARSKLSAREELRTRVEIDLRQRGIYRDSLLAGL